MNVYHIEKNKHTRPTRGFTLIELLVVIAIIGLLAALLMPSISAARKGAQASACAANMREIGKAIMLFAGDHNGRYPGGGGSTTLEPGDFGVNPTSWHDVINEYMGRIVIARLPVHPDSKNTQGKLNCPSMKLLNDGPLDKYKRGYMMNEDAAGGVPDSFSWSAPGSGPYGMMDPNPPAKFKKGFYRLGASTTLCQNPSYMFLLTETSRHRDYVIVWPSEMPNGEPNMGDNASFPTWSGNSGFYSFRHNLKANFLFFDLHVERLSPKDGIVLNDRFYF